MFHQLSQQGLTQLARTRLPLVGLVIANIIPVFGVIYWSWDAGYLLLLYWSENLIIGFYHVFKMLLAGVSSPFGLLGNVFMTVFFSIHYGGFVAGHGLFLIEFIQFGGGSSNVMNDLSWPMFLVFLELLFNVVQYLAAHMSLEMYIAFFALFISHGNSFIINYLLRGEYRKTNTKKLMALPYGRIVVMHLVIIFGGVVVMKTGSPLPILILLVILKIIIDVKLHLRSHKKTIQ